MKEFLSKSGWFGAVQTDLAGDASARSYKRLTRRNGENAILMIDPNGQTSRFAQIARYLTGLGLSAPQIYADDTEMGLMLLEDLGDGLIARLAVDPGTEQKMYLAAIDVLVTLRTSPSAPNLPIATSSFLAGLITPAFDYYLAGQDLCADRQHALVKLFETTLERYAPDANVTVLRDYHADNILWLPERSGVARAGLLDFQDAWLGHPAYDLVSLLQDARRDVSQQTQDTVIAHYVSQTGCDPVDLKTAMAILGAQRHLRILGIFARLSAVHGKTHYIDFIPRTWSYLQTCLAHPELAELQTALDAVLPAPDPDHLTRLRAL